MVKIPKQEKKNKDRIKPNNIENDVKNQNVFFSFEILEKNEYFNLDGTCVNWSSDLFDTMQKVSKIPVKEIYAGKYSGKNSPFRIHQHEKATPPCKVPANIALDDLWQIRISVSKGGVHGLFIDNVFYVIWLDPQHNLYPDENHGGLVKIKPPLTCCKDRDMKIEEFEKIIQDKENELVNMKEYIGMLEEELK